MWNRFTRSEQHIILFVSIFISAGLLINYIWDTVRYNRGKVIQIAIAKPLTEQALAETHKKTGNEINLNFASAKDLEQLPGIGKSKAMTIVQWRESNGLFPSVDSLDNVPGFGPKTLDRLRPLLFVTQTTPTITAGMKNETQKNLQPNSGIPSGTDKISSLQLPVNINTASVSELTSLKGIGESKAQTIVHYRNTNGPFLMMTDLKKVKGIGDKILNDNISRIVVR